MTAPNEPNSYSCAMCGEGQTSIAQAVMHRCNPYPRIDALERKLAAYENGDDVDRVGRVVRKMAEWTDEARGHLLGELSRRWPETLHHEARQLVRENHDLRARVETAEANMRETGELCDRAQEERDAAIERAEKAERDLSTLQDLTNVGTPDEPVSVTVARVVRSELLDAVTRVEQAGFRAADEDPERLRSDVARLTKERDEARATLLK